MSQIEPEKTWVKSRKNCESNRVEKTESNPVKNLDSNWVITVEFCETDDDDYGYHGGG